MLGAARLLLFFFPHFYKNRAEKKWIFLTVGAGKHDRSVNLGRRARVAFEIPLTAATFFIQAALRSV